MITEFVESTMRKGLQRYAKQTNQDLTDVQLLFAWDEVKQKSTYKLLSANAPSKIITFNEFLGIPYDLLSREQIVRQVVGKTIEKYSQELNCPSSIVTLVLYLIPQEEDDDTVKIHLYKGSEAVKEVKLEEIMINA